MPTRTWRVPIGLAIKDRDVASRFGSKVAEAPILARMKDDEALGKPGDFGLYADKGNNDSDPEMFIFIGLRNELPTERITEMKDYRACRAKRKWSRPDALCHTRAAREYYEIKPESAPSMTEGERKLPNIDDFIEHFKLPYRRGKSYLNKDGATDEAELLANDNPFQLEVQALQAMLSLRRIRLFIHWERPEDGLIVYRAKVTVETDDPLSDDFPLLELAVNVVKLGVQAAVPGVQFGVSATSALAAVLGRIREQVDQLRRNLENLMKLHQSLLSQATPSTFQKVSTAVGLLNPMTAVPTLVNVAVNPAMRPVVGAGVQMLNPAKQTLEIWKRTQGALAAAEAALRARKAAKALEQLAVGKGSFVRASEQLNAFRNGTELAARRAQLLIGVTAAVAVLAAIVAFAAPGVAVAAGETVTAGAAQPQVGAGVEALSEGVKEAALAETEEALAEAAETCSEAAPKLLMRAFRP